MRDQLNVHKQVRIKGTGQNPWFMEPSRAIDFDQYLMLYHIDHNIDVRLATESFRELK